MSTLPTQKISILFFSVLRDITQTAELTWPVDAHTTLGGLLEQLYQRWPDLRAWDGSLLLAINQTYATRDALIPANAEVALMPPVQGG